MADLKPVVLSGDIAAFLMGEAAYDGIWFGELNEGMPGPFWWRSIIATARRFTPPANAAQPAIERLTKAIDVWASDPSPATEQAVMDAREALAAQPSVTPADAVERARAILLEAERSFKGSGRLYRTAEAQAAIIDAMIAFAALQPRAVPDEGGSSDSDCMCGDTECRIWLEHGHAK